MSEEALLLLLMALKLEVPLLGMFAVLIGAGGFRASPIGDDF